MKNRKQTIIKTSIIGIVTNVLLAVFKAVIGLVSSSIAIVLDAINNLSDALSSIITIIGTKLAGKAPDKKHPYGHGRIEYLSATIIAIIVAYAGITSLIESIKKIIHPEIPDYKIVSLVIIAIAVIVKIILGLYVKKVGKKVKSESLVDSGTDALMDSIISASTLIAALIFILSGISLESYLGLVISLIIIKSAYEMLASTLSQILGERVSKEVAISVKKTIANFSEVKGAFDLTLNDYGPEVYLGSVHIEIEDTMTAAEIDELTRKITNKVYEKHGVILTAVGIYSINTKDKEAIKVREEINKIISKYKSVIQLHGYYFNKKEKTINFDIIIDFNEPDRIGVYQAIYDKVQAKYKDYNLRITMDVDVSD